MRKKMKDSGIEWAGNVPEDWKIIELRYATKQINESNNPIKFENILSLTNTQGVIPYEEKGNLGNISKSDISQYKIAYKNTVIINSMNLKIGSVGLSNYDGCVSPVYYVLKNRKNSDIKFINYIFQSSFQKYLSKYGKGIMEIREKIPMYDVLHSYIPFPKLEEQKRIVNFLDDKCSKIDKAIELNKKAIEEEKEYKQSYIDNMIEGKNDKLIKLKFIADFNKGLSITKDDLKEEGLAVVSYGQIHSKENDRVSIKDNLIRFVDEDYLKYEHSKVTYGDFIFADTSEDYDGVGNAVYNNKKDMPIYAGYHTIIVRINNNFHNKKYLAYLFNSAKWRKQLRECVTGIKVFSISQKMLKDTFVRIPSSDEQDKIVNRLDKICNEIDQMIEIRQKYIEQLQEYKKSLIYEAVTGKIEV